VNDRLLTADDVAEMLSVPVSWVRESTRSGAMPVVELGRYRRYRAPDVEAWLVVRAAGPAGCSARTVR
jgi:excisionase family DNA binding protein